MGAPSGSRAAALRPLGVAGPGHRQRRGVEAEQGRVLLEQPQARHRPPDEAAPRPHRIGQARALEVDGEVPARPHHLGPERQPMGVVLALAHRDQPLQARHVGEQARGFRRRRHGDAGAGPGRDEAVEHARGHHGVADHARRDEQDLLGQAASSAARAVPPCGALFYPPSAPAGTAPLRFGPSAPGAPARDGQGPRVGAHAPQLAQAVQPFAQPLQRQRVGGAGMGAVADEAAQARHRPPGDDHALDIGHEPRPDRLGGAAELVAVALRGLARRGGVPRLPPSTAGRARSTADSASSRDRCQCRRSRSPACHSVSLAAMSSRSSRLRLRSASNGSPMRRTPAGSTAASPPSRARARRSGVASSCPRATRGPPASDTAEVFRRGMVRSSRRWSRASARRGLGPRLDAQAPQRRAPFRQARHGGVRDPHRPAALGQRQRLGAGVARVAVDAQHRDVAAGQQQRQGAAPPGPSPSGSESPGWVGIGHTSGRRPAKKTRRSASTRAGSGNRRSSRPKAPRRRTTFSTRGAVTPGLHGRRHRAGRCGRARRSSCPAAASARRRREARVGRLPQRPAAVAGCERRHGGGGGWEVGEGGREAAFPGQDRR